MKFFFGLLLFLLALTVWPVALVLVIVWGVLKGLLTVGMDQDFEP